MARAAVFAFPAYDKASICALQTATSLVINGTYSQPFGGSTWSKATLSGFARSVTLSSTADNSAVNITVAGYSWSGLAISQTLTGLSGNTVSTTAQFVTVTSVAGDALITSIEVGFGDVGQSRPFRCNPWNTPGTVGIMVNATGTITYTVRTTYDDVNTVAAPTWTGVTSMSGATTSFQANLPTVPRFVQIQVTGSAGGALNGIVLPTGI